MPISIWPGLDFVVFYSRVVLAFFWLVVNIKV